MTKAPEARSHARERRAAQDARRPLPKPLPGVVFRQLMPSESLVTLAREQDALLRGVVTVDDVASEVVIQKSAPSARRYHVEVSSHTRGQPRVGVAEHERAEWAVRLAYTELLRHTLEQSESRGANARAA